MGTLILFLTAATAVYALLVGMRSYALARVESRQIKRSMGIRSRWDDAFEVDDDELLLDPTIELPERRSLVLFVGDMFDDSERGKQLGAILRNADVRIKPSESLGVVLITAMLSYIAAEVAFTQGPIVSGSIAVIVAIVLPWLVLRSRRDRRLYNFTRQLPTVAELLANSLRAGLSLQSAIDLMAREISAPANEEFVIVVSEVRLGGSLDDSLEALEQRMPSTDLGVMVTAIKVQRIAGGNLIKSMSELSQTLIERRRTQEEIKTLISQATYVAYTMPILSIVALAMFNRTVPGFLDVLFWTLPGLICLGIFILLQVIGLLLIFRFSRIKIAGAWRHELDISATDDPYGQPGVDGLALRDDAECRGSAGRRGAPDGGAQEADVRADCFAARAQTAADVSGSNTLFRPPQAQATAGLGRRSGRTHRQRCCAAQDVLFAAGGADRVLLRLDLRAWANLDDLDHLFGDRAAVLFARYHPGRDGRKTPGADHRRAARLHGSAGYHDHGGRRFRPGDEPCRRPHEGPAGGRAGPNAAAAAAWHTSPQRVPQGDLAQRVGRAARVL